MRKFIVIFFMLFATALPAQVPHIDYMMADEAKSQLQIHGTFASDTTGFVTIENTKQTVRSWSDTMLICDLPDSGAGSGGHVIVRQMSGVSNARMLSIFEGTIQNTLFTFDANPLYNEFVQEGEVEWFIKWRADISDRPSNFSKIIRFEISKTSNGFYNMLGVPYNILSWADSSEMQKDTTITFSGTISLSNYEINFYPTLIQSRKLQGENAFAFEAYQPKSLDFDTTGYLTGYQNDYTTGALFNGTYEKHADSLFNQRILFPPLVKNGVLQSPQPSSDFIKIFSHIGSEDHLISFEAEEPLGEMSASLYSIDGRLLKLEKIFILSPGMYSFDASGINANFGFLVLKTSKGIVAKKVLF